MAGLRDEHGLTKQQRDFADAYVGDPERNASRAYQSVYSARGNVAEVNAARLLRNAQVADFVALREEQIQAQANKDFRVNQGEVLKELVRSAMLDPADLFGEAGELLSIRDMSEDARRAIAGLEYTQITTDQGKSVGRVSKIKLNSKLDALDKLARHLGLYNGDKSQVPQIILSGFIRPKPGDPVDDD